MNRLPERVAGRDQALHGRAGTPSKLADQLAAGCHEMALRLDVAERECLLSYLDLLQRWNRVYNLTAIRDPELMLVQHLLDSLAALPPLQAAMVADRQDPSARSEAPTLVDVGSGAGLPGLVLAIAWPQLHVNLVEPVGKKAAFLRQSAAELGLAARVRVHGSRIEDLELARPPDLVICRAFTSLADFAERISPLIDSRTRVFAMKGRLDELQAEAAGLTSGWRVTDLIALAVPGLEAARHLVRLDRD